MKKIAFGIFYLLLPCLVLFTSCGLNGNNFPSNNDSATVATGTTVFMQNCSGCHNFKQDGIGPQLSGVTKRNTSAWIRQFVTDPKKMMTTHDTTALKLFARYRTVMPSFTAFSDEEMNGLIAFLDTHKNDSIRKTRPPANKSIVSPISPSNLSVNATLLVQVPASSNKSPLARIVKLDYMPNTGQLFVIDLRGKLYRLQGKTAVTYLDIKKLKPAFIDEPGLATGLGSFAFHPDFKNNGLFYTTHTEPASSRTADFRYDPSVKAEMQWVLTEWKADRPNDSVFKGTSRELLRIDFISRIHGIQDIGFNPFATKSDKDYGKLYVAVGDGGTVENGHPEYVHHLNRIWGTIIRIDPQGKNSWNGKYGIPADNPFVRSGDTAFKEIYAYGFRNPNEFSWSRNGLMIASNIGQANIEALNIILPGRDYGWPLTEGAFALNMDEMNEVSALPNQKETAITFPVAQYDHSEGKAIAGGFSYLGTRAKALTGKYLFGDIVSGRLFYVETNRLRIGKQEVIKEWNVEIGGKPVKLEDICGADRVDLRFGRDREGEIYLLTKADGKIYKLGNKGRPASFSY